MPKVTPFSQLAISLSSKLPPKFNLGGAAQEPNLLAARGEGETRGKPSPRIDYPLSVYAALQRGLSQGQLIAVLQDPFLVRFESLRHPKGLLQVTLTRVQYELFLSAASDADTPLEITLKDRGLL